MQSYHLVAEELADDQKKNLIGLYAYLTDDYTNPAQSDLLKRLQQKYSHRPFIEAIDKLEKYISFRMRDYFYVFRDSDATAFTPDEVNNAANDESFSVLIALENLKKELARDDLTTHEQFESIHRFEQACEPKTLTAKNIAKLVVCVITAAVGMVLGGLVGVAFGLATGPAAAAASVGGLFVGSVTGSAIALGILSATTGITLSASIGCCLFSDPTRRLAMNVIKESVEAIDKQATSQQRMGAPNL